jgi:peptidoglycan/LPS O-acetylase OafA/YrhL
MTILSENRMTNFLFSSFLALAIMNTESCTRTNSGRRSWLKVSSVARCGLWSIPWRLAVEAEIFGEPKNIDHTSHVRIMRPRENRIPELDGLRAFMVMFVVLFHMTDYGGSLPRGSVWIGNVIACLGPSGVHVFFIISGFIITTLLLREKVAVGHVSLKAFYIRRFFRIVPPFAVFLIALFGMAAVGVISISSQNLMWSAMFLGDTAFPDPKDWFVAHTWSLSVEEQFYLGFPPLVCLIFGFRSRITIYFLCVFYGISVLSLKLANELSIHVAPQFVRIAALYHFRYIIVGVLLALHGRPALDVVTGRSRMVPLFLAVSIISMQLYSGPSKIVSLVVAAIEPGICGLFVMWFIQNPSRCASLRLPAVQWIGACSYGIYLWQQLFTGTKSLYHGWNLAQSPLAVVAIVVCAGISFYLIERPSIQLGRRISSRILKTTGPRAGLAPVAPPDLVRFQVFNRPLPPKLAQRQRKAAPISSPRRPGKV